MRYWLGFVAVLIVGAAGYFANQARLKPKRAAPAARNSTWRSCS